MKRETAKRVLALLICVLMTASMLPTVAMAEEVMDDTIDNSTETYITYENEDDSDVTVLDDEDDSGSSGGIPIDDEKPNTDIKIIPSDANALVLMDTGAQSPRGVPGQVVTIVLPLAVNKEYLPSEKYMLRNINIWPDVPSDTSVSNWPFELIYASDLQHLKDMSYNSTAEVWFEFKISEFASQGRYAVPFKVNATVWREDAVNGTSITEDVTFKITAYVTVTDNGNMSGVTTSFGSLQVAGTNVDGSYTVPTGTPNQTISMRIPVINVGGTITPSRTRANAGDEIIVTVTPDSGYQMVADSLTYTLAIKDGETVKITNNRFTMPEGNVTISCQWETAATTAKGITAFSINGVAGAVNNTTNTITITMPRGTDVTKLTPVIATNGVKSLTPGSGVTMDFTNAVTYTATMEDGSTKTYIVTVYVNKGTLSDQFWDKMTDFTNQVPWWEYAKNQQSTSSYPKYW